MANNVFIMPYQYCSYEFVLVQSCAKSGIVYNVHTLFTPGLAKSGAIRLYNRNDIPYLRQSVHNIRPIKNLKNGTHHMYQTHRKDIYMRLCTL